VASRIRLHAATKPKELLCQRIVRVHFQSMVLLNNYINKIKCGKKTFAQTQTLQRTNLYIFLQEMRGLYEESPE
jgi:hypothetical protein